MRSKPKNASRHHGAFGRMRLRYDGHITRGNGSTYHRFEISNPHSRWATTALGKLRLHLGEEGYDEGVATERLDNRGLVHARTHVFRNGDDEVRVDTYVDGGTGSERAWQVAHFPGGTAGDGRNRMTLGQVIGAMSWGMAPA